MKRKENMKEHDSNCPKITDYPYKIIITPGSESGKTNPLFNLISYHQILLVFFICWRSIWSKYQLLIYKHKKTCLKDFNNSIAFLKYSNDMDDI